MSSHRMYPGHHSHRHSACRSVFFLLLITCTLLHAENAPDIFAALDSVINNFPVTYCCGTTLGKCIERKPECSIASHLKAFGTWMTLELDPPPPPDKVRKQLDSRYEGFTTKETAAIDTAHLQRAGNPKAPVTIFVYASATCPLCKRIVGELYDSVMFSGLKNSASLLVKPFGGGIGNIALCAAAEEGNFWKLFKALRYHEGVIKEEAALLELANSIGIATEQFKKRLEDPQLQQRLTANKEEGLRNGVKYIPTMFINGKRYRSYKDPRWVADAVRFEMEKKPAPVQHKNK